MLILAKPLSPGASAPRAFTSEVPANPGRELTKNMSAQIKRRRELLVESFQRNSAIRESLACAILSQTPTPA